MSLGGETYSVQCFPVWREVWSMHFGGFHSPTRERFEIQLQTWHAIGFDERTVGFEDEPQGAPYGARYHVHYNMRDIRSH